MKNKLLIFLKGLLMGICDIIPGISGGTIAFITGIYAQLIESIKAISPKIIWDFLKLILKRDKKSLEEFKRDIKKINLGFLITLLSGIIIALLIGSRVITFLLENYFVYTISFFIGLILASSKIIYDNIDNHKLKEISFGIIGFIVGILLSILIPININSPSLMYIFIGGFFAISAMFLPGISGAFILLIMGLYGYIINLLHNLRANLKPLLIFILGIAFGAFFISRVISFLFKKDKSKTLYFLLGLVIGALSIPIKNVLENNLQINDYVFAVIFIILGVGIVRFVKNYSKKLR